MACDIQPLIRIKRNGKVVHSETETFDKKSLAKDWAARRESELKVPGTLEQVRHKGVTVRQVLERYRDDYDGKSKFGRTKLGHIEFLINHPTFSSLDAIKLTSSQLVPHIAQRRRNGAVASTANNDLIWLRNALRAIRIGRGTPLDIQVIDDTSFLCRKEKLVAKSKQSTRRPSMDELNALMEYFNDRDGRATIPVVEITLFALFSSRRQEEICRIQWSDLDQENKRVLVRDMKHPREKTDARGG